MLEKLIKILSIAFLWGFGLTSCSDNSESAIPLADGIGHTSISIYDASRNRTIDAEIFYPALVSGDDVPVFTGQYPVIVFGHGYLIEWSFYEWLWTSLTPGGYIMVFADSETGVFPDHLDFGKDLAFLADEMTILNADSTSLFYNHIAPSTLVMGHSMGGGATFLATQHSNNITACAALTPAETNPSAISAALSIGLPTMVFAGSEDCVTPPAEHQLPIFNNLLSTCKTYVLLEGASHCQFAQNNGTCVLGETFSGCSATIALNTQESMTTTLLQKWCDGILKDDNTAWLSFEEQLESLENAGTITTIHDCPETASVPIFGSGGQILLLISISSFLAKRWLHRP